MIDSGKAYDTTLFYCVNFHDELAYSMLWDEAEQKIGMRYIPVVAKENLGAPYETGFVTAEMIQRLVPDYLERTWYISGPPGMVSAYGALLRELRVPYRQIVKDFFPGV
jgi:ferredoxin-NADP reductase